MDIAKIAQAEKIRKIIARASSPFEGEAQLAAQRAWELISRYALQYPQDILPVSNGSRWTSNDWAGFGQIRDHSGSIKKGQHGTLIEKWFKTTDRNGKQRLACKRMCVFNTDQITWK